MRENEPDNIRDTEDIAASRKRSVADNSTALSGEKRKKVTHVAKKQGVTISTVEKWKFHVAKKQGVTISTVEKWKRDYDKSLNTCLWLEYEKMDREFVSVLKCNVCK